MLYTLLCAYAYAQARLEHVLCVRVRIEIEHVFASRFMHPCMCLARAPAMHAWLIYICHLPSANVYSFQKMALTPGSSRDYSPELFSVDSNDEESLFRTSPQKRPCLSDRGSCSVESSNGSPVYLSESDTSASTNSCGAPVYLSDNESSSCSADSVHSSSVVTGSPLSDKAIGRVPTKNTGHGYNDDCYVGLDEPPLPPQDGDLAEVSHILVGKCCSGECLLKLCARDVIPIRRKMRSFGLNEKRQWMTDKVLENSQAIEPGKINTRFFVAGREVCKSAWCTVHGVSSRQLSRVTNRVSLGQVTTEHGNKGKRRYNAKSSGAKAWMDRYFHLIGDKMPHNNQVHLPSWETQKDLFFRYESDMKQQGLPESDIVSLSTFYRIWNEDFPHVVIPEV